MTSFEIAVLVLLAVQTGIGFWLIRRTRPEPGISPEKLDLLAFRLTELQSAMHTGFSGIREEGATSARLAREEIAHRMDGLSSTLLDTIGAIGKAQGERLDGFGTHLRDAQTASEQHAKTLREELVGNFDKLSASTAQRMSEQATDQTRRLDSFATQLVEHRSSAAEDAKALREEVARTLQTLGGSLSDNLKTVTTTVKEMMETNDRRQETLKQTVEGRLDAIRTENADKLEQMRVTVDEKLQGTLEARLGASFTQVNENLERVYKSVGEMQTIATGVGDLKRVLTNVKSRGTWGEVTLGYLLEQVMTPEQYGQNVEVRPASGQRVEYAIRLPGDGEAPIWLPIDAKMPTEDYERLVEASERGDAAAVEEAVKGIERAIKLAAKDISTKYVCPPHSTDFGIMFLPNEGLYAEVVRRPGLVDSLQRDFRVSVAGPTNLLAMLNSLRMGFRTLAIQERSSEVWTVLGKVKHEFTRFGDVLDKVHKKLNEAQKVVSDAGVRKRAVDRQLRDVEVQPVAAGHDLLSLAVADLIDEEADGETRAAE